ncbi:MAG: hypothetical protein Q4D38_07930 [Planctomycetia bacterium]|nr:hypothetical protein [Planctomycetia bacterium]
MSRKNKKDRRRSAPKKVSREASQQDSTQISTQKPKKRFYTRATVLHIVSLTVSFVLVCILSYIISTRTIVEQVPASVEGWFSTKNAAGEIENVEFRLGAAPAFEIANMIDDITPQRGKMSEKYGELKFTFTSKRTRTFYLTSNGVYDTQGFYRYRPLHIDAIRRILREGVESGEKAAQ